MSFTFGPIALFLDDIAVDQWADRLQEKIDHSYIAIWEMRVRLVNDNHPWEEISHEPYGRQCSLFSIKAACWRILKEHRVVDSILIKEAFVHDSDSFLLTRPKNCTVYLNGEGVPDEV